MVFTCFIFVSLLRLQRFTLHTDRAVEILTFLHFFQNPCTNNTKAHQPASSGNDRPALHTETQTSSRQELRGRASYAEF